MFNTAKVYAGFTHLAVQTSVKGILFFFTKNVKNLFSKGSLKNVIL